MENIMEEKESTGFSWRETIHSEHGPITFINRRFVEPVTAVSKKGFKIIWSPNWKLIILTFFMVFLFVFMISYSIDEVNEQFEKSNFHTRHRNMGEHLKISDSEILAEDLDGKLKVEMWISEVDTAKHIVETELYFFPSSLMLNKSSGGLLMPLKADFRYYQEIFPANTLMKSTRFNLPLLTGSPFYYPFGDYHASLDLEVINLLENKLIPIDVDVLVSSPSTWFELNRLPGRSKYFGTENLKESSYHFDLVISRPDNVVVFSMFIFILLWILTLAILSLTLTIVFFTEARPGAPYLGLGPALLFAFPNLRAVQPGVPNIGILIDVVGFFWNMALISISSVVMIYIWIKRKDSLLVL